jgi:hypothetical protein
MTRHPSRKDRRSNASSGFPNGRRLVAPCPVKAAVLEAPTSTLQRMKTPFNTVVYWWLVDFTF